jgi:hypothetical protein
LPAPDSTKQVYLQKGQLVATHTPPVTSPTCRPWPFPVCKWQQQPWLTRLVRKRCWGSSKQNAFLLQEGTVSQQSRATRRGSLDEITHYSAHMLSPEDAVGLATPLPQTPFSSSDLHTRATFSCHGDKGIWRREAVACWGTKRKALTLTPVSPQDNLFRNNRTDHCEQDSNQFLTLLSVEVALYRSTQNSQWMSCYKHNLGICLPVEWQPIFCPSLKCYLKS